MNIPWGPVFLIGGIAALTMTDWPGIIGWLLVIFGVLMTLVWLVALFIIGAAVGSATSNPSSITYTRARTRRRR